MGFWMELSGVILTCEGVVEVKRVEWAKRENRSRDEDA